jgi:hypothetical protein
LAPAIIAIRNRLILESIRSSTKSFKENMTSCRNSASASCGHWSARATVGQAVHPTRPPFEVSLGRCVQQIMMAASGRKHHPAPREEQSKKVSTLPMLAASATFLQGMRGQRYKRSPREPASMKTAERHRRYAKECAGVGGDVQRAASTRCTAPHGAGLAALGARPNEGSSRRRGW